MACGQKYYKSTEYTEGTDHRNLDGCFGVASQDVLGGNQFSGIVFQSNTQSIKNHPAEKEYLPDGI